MRGTPKRVLLADMSSWETWIHLAGALRTRGVEVVRVTGRDLSIAQRIRLGLERVVFSDTHSRLERDPAGRPQISGLLPWLADVDDVQVADSIGAVLTTSEYWPQYRHLHRCSELPDRVLYDKLAYSRIAATAGVPVSESVPLRPDLRPADPPAGQLLLKARVGSGGQHVTFLDSEKDIERILRSWRLRPKDVFLQRALSGDPLTVGGVARDGEVLVSTTYETRGSCDEPFAPAVHIRIRPHSQAQAFAARTVGALGYTGPFAMDFIDDGVAHLIDFNPRFFGAWAVLQANAVDLLGAYLATLGEPWTGAGPDVSTPWLRASTRGQEGVAGIWGRTRGLSSMLRPVIGRRASAVIGIESAVASVRRPAKT